MVPYQAERHIRRLGDVPERGAVHAALREQLERRIPDPSPRRQVFG
jgi:hypothetical protein